MRPRGAGPAHPPNPARRAMSYAEESHALAAGLTRLMARQSADLDPPGYAQALIGRSATLALAAAVHREVAGIGPHAVGRALADLEAHPVAALGRALYERVRVEPDVAPSEVLARTSGTTTGRAWGEVARRAILAHHDWSTGLSGGWTPVRAWTALADVAAMTETVTVLDRDLAVAAHAQGRHQDATSLTTAARSGLRVAAAEVHALALAGPLAAEPVERVPMDRARVLPVATIGDLPGAQERLAAMLNHTLCLRPEHATQIVLGQARNAATIAALLRRASNTSDYVEALGAGLGRLTRPLLTAANRPRRTASIYPGDPRPLYQAGEMTRLLTRAEDGQPTPDDVEALVCYAAHLGPVIRALTMSAGRETSSGRWLVPSQDEASTWIRFQPNLVEPPLLTGLRGVIPQADRVSAAATACQRSPAPTTLGLPPRHSLPAALALGQRSRPTAPGNRPQVMSPGAVSQTVPNASPSR